MKTSGAFVIVQNERHQILLVKRRDFPLWDLPGGRVEIGESPEQAGVRETFEETGFKTKLTNLSGTYVNPELADTQYIFAGNIIGGSAISSGPETAKIKFFNPNHLPLLMISHRKMQIQNYLKAPSKNFQVPIHDNWLVKFFKKR